MPPANEGCSLDFLLVKTDGWRLPKGRQIIEAFGLSVVFLGLKSVASRAL